MGNSPFSIALSDAAFWYNDVQFSFTPGSSLSFDLAATSNVDAIAPDTFTFAIFDNTFSEIPTTNPNWSFLELDLPTPNTGMVVITSGSTSDSGVDVPAPSYFQGAETVPEPSTMLLLGTGLAALARWRRRRS